jgi:FlaA1/EpsC-like NDP-sugar epimerase
VKYKDRHKLAEAAERVAASNQLASGRFSPMEFPRSLEEAIGGKTILVTGGTGSIGREIVFQLLDYKPRVVRVLSRNEYHQYRMKEECAERFGRNAPLRFLLGDVRDKERLLRACEDVELLFHAAALKHVPLCEFNPFEAVKTNVLGTQHAVEAALDYNMALFVGISTDKAVSPTNTMGATKLLAERLVLSAGQYKGDRRTRFCVVRFGNVLASRGSAIPRFVSQIRSGGPVTLTHQDMRRFFMSIPQAVELALKAALASRGGEVFILKMPALSINDLIAALIEIYAPRFGHRPESIGIRQIGLLPGEKLNESLMTPEEALQAEEQDQFYIVRPLDTSRSDAPHPAGYNSELATLLSRGEIASLLQQHNLVEAFLDEV